MTMADATGNHHADPGRGQTNAAEQLAANLANWEERVPIHLTAYGTDDFVADSTSISVVVKADLLALAPHLPNQTPAGLDLLHLQCHIGTDTLSWARLGARVTGVDFSPAALEAARDLATRAGLAARFVESDVARADEVIDEKFDVVYTSIGTITWLPDLTAWARVISTLLRPGGVFFIRDGHPMVLALDDAREDEELVVKYPYFATGAASRWDDPSDYADPEAHLENGTTFEWPHSIAEILRSLLRAGLRVIDFDEGRTLPWKALPHMVESDGGWALTEGTERVPLTYTVIARK
jgi:SAM-dependent methyltransferase